MANMLVVNYAAKPWDFPSLTMVFDGFAIGYSILFANYGLRWFKYGLSMV